MQATTTKRNGFGIDHLKVALIAVGLFVATLAGAAGWQLSQDATTASVAPIADRVEMHRPADRPFTSNRSASVTTQQQVAVAKEVRQDTLELAAAAFAARAAQQETLQQFYAHKEASMDAEFSAITAQPTLEQRVALDKESRLAAQEQLRSELTARTTRQETLRRYYAHKEAQIDARP